MTVRVFLLDDHEVVRRGVRELLEVEPDFEVVGEAGTAEEAIARIPSALPDVAVVDMRLPDGNAWRRVVASPVPRSIVETPTIELLLQNNVVVVCAGGGGVPIVIDHFGARRGVEAVVDKDAATALLARVLGADLLLLLTDVPAVDLDWGTSRARPIGRVTPDELARHSFAPGSMAPKVQAATAFVSVTGRRAAIGSLDATADLVAGTVGTQIVPATATVGAGADN